MNIFLTGMMGSGKSHWMRFLAQQLKLEGFDLDGLVEEKTGKSVAEIFSEQGENFFRKAETAVLRSFAGKNGFVLATGGGTPCFQGNMEWMNDHGLTIFLDEPVELLVQRLLPEKSQRPLIAKLEAGDLPRYLEQKREERLPYYESAAIILRGQDINPAMILKTIQQHQHA